MTVTIVTGKVRNRRATPKKKRSNAKLSKRDVYRVWGIPEALIGKGWRPRYQYPLEKGILWYFFSIFIRTRDVNLFGTCISCDRPLTSIDQGDCGHFIPAGQCGRDLLFDERNNNLECGRCNAWDDMHLVGYAKGLDKRYGPGTADELIRRYQEYKNGPPVKDWPRSEYIAMLNALLHDVR